VKILWIVIDTPKAEYIRLRSEMKEMDRTVLFDQAPQTERERGLATAKEPLGKRGVSVDDVYEFIEFRYGVNQLFTGTKVMCSIAGTIYTSELAKAIESKLKVLKPGWVLFQQAPSAERDRELATEHRELGIRGLFYDDIKDFREERYGVAKKLICTKLTCVRAGEVFVDENSEDVAERIAAVRKGVGA